MRVFERKVSAGRRTEQTEEGRKREKKHKETKIKKSQTKNKKLENVTQ